MKILITGATGFIGAHLIRYFHSKGHQIIALGRGDEPPPELDSFAQYIKADITFPIQNIDCDMVIHTAAIADDQSDLDTLIKTNRNGTKHVFEASTKASLFIQISSASVYHFDGTTHQEDKKIDLAKLSPYGQSKRLAELYLEQQKSDQKNIVILRPRAVYGIGDRILLPRILSLPKNNKVFFPGKSEVPASLTNIRNLIHAIELVIAKNTKGFVVYNVTDAVAYPLRQTIKYLIKNGYQQKITFYAIPLTLVSILVSIIQFMGIRSKLTKQALSYLTQANLLSTYKIETELGYQPITSFDREKKQLSSWIQHRGLEQIIKEPALLPWTM